MISVQICVLNQLSTSRSPVPVNFYKLGTGFIGVSCVVLHLQAASRKVTVHQ